MLVRVQAPNGLRYLRWAGDGEAVQPEKGQGAENCLDVRTPPKAAVPSARCMLYWAVFMGGALKDAAKV
jgi:hypothetical protein